MKDHNWTQLPAEPFFNSRKDNIIRAWEPGDGLICSSGERGRSPIRCGPPVAVLASSQRNGTRHSVLCSLHVADVVRQLTRDTRHLPGIKTDAQRIARERIVAAHWEEYQAAVDEALQSVTDEVLALLPDGLRARMAEVAREVE